MNDERRHLDGYPVSASTYTNHGCRCDGCRQAQNAFQRDYWKRNPRKWQDRLEHVREMRRMGWWP